MSDINPRVDIAFKKLFGVEENKDLLISLLNAILTKEDQVSEITLLNPYNGKQHKNDKLSILDIKAKGVDGKRFNIEIQITDEANYDKRALYYWAKIFIEQLQINKNESEFGKNYAHLNKAIGIHILNFTSIPETNKYHNIFRIKEIETGVSYFNDLELHTIELEKFTKNVPAELSAMAAQIKTSLDRWAAFLTRHNLLKQDALPQPLDDPALKKAMHVLEVMNFNDAERAAYEDHLKWLLLEASALNKKFAEGKAEGKAEVAMQLISIGMPLEQICQVTGLDKAIVQQLQRAM